MTSPSFPRQSAFLLGAAIMMVAACGGSGLATKGSGKDASLATGGSGGQNSRVTSSGGTTTYTSSGMSSSAISSSGGAPSNSGGAISSAISNSAGSPSSSGGAISSAISNSAGSPSSSGGAVSSSARSSSSSLGGSAGGGTVVSPREPLLHRPKATSCVGVFAPPEPVDPPSGSICTKHADCKGGKNGRCIMSSVGASKAMRSHYCVYDNCATDADCDPGMACFCTPSNSAQCFSSGNCRTDADCGPGATSYCSPSWGSDCSGYHWYSGYYCHTPKDTCIEDSDCTGKDFCSYSVVSGRWECTPPNKMCAIG